MKVVSENTVINDVITENHQLDKDDMTMIEFGSVEYMPAPAVYDEVTFDDGYDYYTPPIDLTELADLILMNSYHGSIVEARTRILSRDYIETAAMTFADFMNVSKDLITFGFAYIQIPRNAFGAPKALVHTPALRTRKGKNNRFCQIDLETDIVIKWFKKDEIYQIKLYDPKQNIYGIPDYLSGIQSALLSKDATQFRRRYYLNGSHAGFLLYTTSPSITGKVQEDLEEVIGSSRGLGNFKSIHLNIPGGDDKGVQLIKIGDAGAKDEFSNIKSISNQDVLTAHRFPPEISGIIAAQGSALGDPEKYNQMYYTNEVIPMQKLIMGVNSMFKANPIKFDNPFKEE